MRMNDVEICNDAIGLVGSTDFIQSLTDPNSAMARRCNRYFEPAVERVLRKHNWSSATKVIELAQNIAAPAIEYDFSYALPSDCVKVINIYGDSTAYSPYDRWRVVKRNINTDLGKVYLKYVQFPEDYQDLDILLADAITYELALKLAPAQMKDIKLYSILFQASRQACAEAKAMDTMENKELYVENSVWEDARLNIGGNLGTGRG